MISRVLGVCIFAESLSLYHLPGMYEPFSAATHLAGAVFFALWGARLLARSSGDRARQMLEGVYVVSCVLLMTVSGLYHATITGGRASQMASELGMSAFELRSVALVDMLFFFGVLLVGFAYLWRFGYLDWVRSAATTSIKIDYRPGIDLRQEARVDRPI
jgi:cytochrome bd-type quinol oxidase subunit 2